jgi:hypothetical protein
MAMIDWTNGWVIAGLVAGNLLLLVIGALLVQAGCALADVTGPGFFKALGVFLAAQVICAPLGWALVWAAGLYGGSAGVLTPLRGLALVVALLATWVISALIFALTLAAPYRKGLMIAGAELVLGALISAVVTGVVLVVLALVQIARQPPPRPTAAAGVPAAVARAYLP